MEDFINETINTKDLPRYEEVEFTKLHPSYWKEILITVLFFFLILGGFLIFVYFIDDELAKKWIYFAIPYFVLLLLVLSLSRLSFNKKGYAFRTHDVLFKSGIIATSTIVIPYNRVQHVALHEGLISRFLGLAKVEIFTAGASSSDIHIPGIEKEQAESIKQLLMGKIQKEL